MVKKLELGCTIEFRAPSSPQLRPCMLPNPSSILDAKGGRNTGRGTYSPYKVANFFFGIRIARVRIDPKHDIDVISGHFHPLDQGADAIPLARPISCS
jgi:hypothetical protein